MKTITLLLMHLILFYGGILVGQSDDIQPTKQFNVEIELQKFGLTKVNPYYGEPSKTQGISRSYSLVTSLSSGKSIFIFGVGYKTMDANLDFSEKSGGLLDGLIGVLLGGSIDSGNNSPEAASELMIRTNYLKLMLGTEFYTDITDIDNVLFFFRPRLEFNSYLNDQRVFVAYPSIDYKKGDPEKSFKYFESENFSDFLQVYFDFGLQLKLNKFNFRSSLGFGSKVNQLYGYFASGKSFYTINASLGYRI